MLGASPLGLIPLGLFPFAEDQAAGSMVGVESQSSGDYEIFVATAEFITGASDQPANAPFRGTLQQALDYSRTISGDDGFSGFASGQGSMSVLNLDGRYDFLPQFYALDGRDQEIRIGTRDVPYRDWFTIFKGTAAGFHLEDTLYIDLQDYGHKLDVPLQPNLFAGTGGKEGGDDLKGKPKPRAYGYCENVTPVLVDATTLLYCVHDGRVQDIAVFADQVALTNEGDVVDAATLIAASITSGRFKTCLAEGLFRLDYELDSTTITADVQGDATDGDFAATIPAIVRRMAETALTDEEFYEPAFAAYAATADFEACYFADPGSTVTIRQAVARVLGYGSFASFRRIGKFAIGRVEHPAGRTPSLFIEKRHVLKDTLRRERLPSGLFPPPHRVKVGWGRNNTVLSGPGIENGASAARRAFATEELRYAVAESAATKVNHPLAQERVIAGYLRNEADAQSEASRIQTMHAATSALYRFKVPFLMAADLELGEVANLTFDRYDLHGGRNLLAVAIASNVQENWTEIQGWG